MMHEVKARLSRYARVWVCTSLLAVLFLPSHRALAQSQQQTTTTGTTDNSQTPQKKTGLWGKLVANAQYQQAKQNGNPNANNFLPQDSGSKDSKKKHLCNINDDGVSLQPDGSWAGPNCITSDGNGHAKNPQDMKDDKPKNSDDAQAKRASD